jgi:hypothetical protein
MAQQPPPGDDRFHIIEGDSDQPALTRLVFSADTAGRAQLVFSESFKLNVPEFLIKVHGIEVEVVDDVPIAPDSARAIRADPSDAPIDSLGARRRPGVLEVALFCMPRAMREDFESFIGDLREQCAEKAAEGWPRPLLVVTAAAQVTIVLVVGLWKTGVLKTLGLLRLLGL